MSSMNHNFCQKKNNYKFDRIIGNMRFSCFVTPRHHLGHIYYPKNIIMFLYIKLYKVV